MLKNWPLKDVTIIQLSNSIQVRLKLKGFAPVEFWFIYSVYKLQKEMSVISWYTYGNFSVGSIGPPHYFEIMLLLMYLFSITVPSPKISHFLIIKYL